MKKQYQSPTLEIRNLSFADTIRTSGEQLSNGVDKPDGEWGFNPWSNGGNK